MIWTAILLLVSIILESTLWPYPLTLVMVFMLISFFPQNSLLLIFLAGVILDLFNLRLLGMDSLIFLLIYTVIDRYSKKLQKENILFSLTILGTALITYNLLFFRNFDPVETLITLVLSGVLYVLIKRFFTRERINGRLEV